MPWTMNVVVGVDEDAHPATAIRAASFKDTERSAYLHAVLLEDLEALFLPRAGDAEDRDLLRRVVAELDAGLDHAAGDDVDPGVGDDRHHHRDLVHARLLEHELGQPARLRDRRVAADLAVVGGLAAVGADGVEQRQRAAAGADHEPEVAVELGDVAGHAAVVLLVDGLAGELELGRLAGLARLLVADAELRQQRLLARPRLVLHVHVGVDGDERAVRELRQRVDLGQRHVVLGEQPRQPGQDRRQPRQRAAGDADGGDHLLGLVVAERPQGREVGAADVVGVGLGDLLDVDPAHVAEDQDRPLAGAVPGDAGVVLLRDVDARVDEHPAGHVPVDLQLEDVRRMTLRFLGRVGELDAARLHPPAGQHLRLDDGRRAQLFRDLARFRRGRGEAVARHRNSGFCDDLS